MTKEDLNLKSKLEGNELDLSLMDLKEVPVRDLSALPKATHLDLSCNKISVIPPAFCSLTHLVKLDLGTNQIKELPSNFGQLENLNYLDLYSNEIQVLPASFSQLKKLKWLDLKDNPLKPQLKAIAGDCIDGTQCKLCATNVVNFMVEVCNQLEKEREQRLQEENAKEEARKLAEEKEKEKQRLAKKAAKKKRIAEMKAKQEKFEQETQTSLNQTEEPVKNRVPDLPSEKLSGQKKTLGALVWLLTIIGLAAAIGFALLWHYTQLDLSEERLTLARIQFQQDKDYVMNRCADFTNIMTDVIKRSTERTVTYTSNCFKQALQWFENNFVSKPVDTEPLVTEQNDPPLEEEPPPV